MNGTVRGLYSTAVARPSTLGQDECPGGVCPPTPPGWPVVTTEDPQPEPPQGAGEPDEVVVDESAAAKEFPILPVAIGAGALVLLLALS